MTAYPPFPELSRAPSPLEGDETPIDPTLRDPMENGMESTRARFTRVRRTFTVSIRYLTFDDKQLLDDFYQTTVVYGSKAFQYTDTRDEENPRTYLVRFASLPKYAPAGRVQGPDDADAAHRVHVQFQIREV